MSDASLETLLSIGDDALIAAQRLGAQYAAAATMEEDMALANIALDQLGVARAVLSYAGEVEGAGRDEDGLAFLRGDREFRNALLVELAEPHFGATVAKLLFLSAYQSLRYEQLAGGPDPRLAAIAAKAVKESAYHLDHARVWTVRLGDGTPESHRRMQSAVDDVWPYTHELFEGETATLRPAWLSTVDETFAEATLVRPSDGWRPSGGRHGEHTEALSLLLAEMQVLHRAHPGARW